MNRIKSREKQVLEFLKYVSKLEPVEYCALCRILCVDLFDKEKNGRKFEDTIGEVIDGFAAANRKARRQIMELLKSATEMKK